MAEGWDEGWADPPPGLLPWNRLPSTPEHSRAQISVNPTADELLISRALALGERKKGNLPAILPSLSCYQFGCSACRQVWPRLDEYHKWQNIVVPPIWGQRTISTASDSSYTSSQWKCHISYWPDQWNPWYLYGKCSETIKSPTRWIKHFKFDDDFLLR